MLAGAVAAAAVTKHYGRQHSCVAGTRNSSRKCARHLVFKKHKFISVQQRQLNDDEDEDYDRIELTFQKEGRSGRR